MATPTADRDTILRTIETWSIPDQVALARQILQRAAAQHTLPQRPSWRELAGIAATGAPPPSDETVAEWLDDHRREKRGV